MWGNGPPGSADENMQRASEAEEASEECMKSPCSASYASNPTVQGLLTLQVTPIFGPQEKEDIHSPPTLKDLSIGGRGKELGP